MSDIRWGRVALLVPVALALLPVALVAAVLLGPAAFAFMCLYDLTMRDWFPHPGELIAGVVCPVMYTVAMGGLGLTWLRGGDDWSPAWILLGSVVVAVAFGAWAARDYRHRREARP